MTDTEALLAAAIHETRPVFDSRDVCRCAKHAARILATPSGQRLLAPTERERALARFIQQHTSPTWGGDWACVECRPESDMLIEGFRCSWHEAEHILAAQPDAPEAAS